jgi:hypothetical protein
MTKRFALVVLADGAPVAVVGNTKAAQRARREWEAEGCRVTFKHGLTPAEAEAFISEQAEG